MREKKWHIPKGNNNPIVKTFLVFMGLPLNGCIAPLNHWRDLLLDNKSNNGTPSHKSPRRTWLHWLSRLSRLIQGYFIKLPHSTSAARLLQLNGDCKEWGALSPSPNCARPRTMRITVPHSCSLECGPAAGGGEVWFSTPAWSQWASKFYYSAVF